MKELLKALAGFWADACGCSAYLSGAVPEGASLPYVTFDAVMPDGMHGAYMDAIWWTRDTGTGNADRAEMFASIADKLPSEGVKIDLDDGGFVILDRNETNFQSIYNDPQDSDVIGGRISYYVRVYTR